MKMSELIIKLLFPPRCFVCGEAVDGYELLACPECVKTLPFNTHSCRVCGVPLNTVYGDDICPTCRNYKKYVCCTAVPFTYKESIRRAIIVFKFYRKSFLARTFASFIFIEMKRMGIQGDIITFVPIHFFRKGARGYNQSELIARELSKISGIPTVSLIKKTKNTSPLSGMNRSLRREAVKGVYSPLKNAQLNGESIILIDDVVTTGSTVNECAKVIKQMGASRVSVCAVAATPSK